MTKELDEHYDSCQQCSKAYHDYEMCEIGKQLQQASDAFYDSFEVAWEE